MRLYSITTTFLLCLSALLCASQETADVGSSTPGLSAITDHRPPLNESYSPPTAIGPRRLFSRTKGESGLDYKRRRGPVQLAWEKRGAEFRSGGYNSVFKLPNHPVNGGHRVPLVIKRVAARLPLEEQWVKLQLVYLETVGQLVAHGTDGWYHYIVMPDLGLSWAKAREKGMRLKCEKGEEKKGGKGETKLVKEAMGQWTKKVAAAYENKLGIKHLDVSLQNMVFRRTYANKWSARLISWEYAQFVSQPQVPKEQHFSSDCQVDNRRPRDEQCVYWAYMENRGKKIEKGAHYLKKEFLSSPAIVRKITARTIQVHRTVHHEVMNQDAIGQLLAWASKPCQGDSSSESETDEARCMYYYLVTKNMGVPAKDLEPQLSKSGHPDLREQARKRYEQEFKLIYSEDNEKNYVYRLVPGSETEVEANIIDGWAFALPVGHANPPPPETFIV